MNNNTRDPQNNTYSPQLGNVYDADGNLQPFQQQKYRPIIDCIGNYCQQINKPLTDVQLLDIGIGYGAFLHLCAQSGIKQLYGMDPFPGSIAIAAKYTNAQLHINTIENTPWPFEPHQFDIITCLDVVEHLSQPATFFEHVKPYIKSTSLIIVRTPNGQLPYKMRKLPLIGIPDTNPTHINVYPPAYWKQLARKNGFIVANDWKGERLEHIRLFSSIANKLCKLLHLDHRQIPLLNHFEQSFVMTLQLTI